MPVSRGHQPEGELGFDEDQFVSFGSAAAAEQRQPCAYARPAIAFVLQVAGCAGSLAKIFLRQTGNPPPAIHLAPVKALDDQHLLLAKLAHFGGRHIKAQRT